MRITDFNYFGKEKVNTDVSQKITKVTQKDFDLDLQQVSEAGPGVKTEMLGSGHFWCHVTDNPQICTGAVCVSIIACG